MTPEEFQEWKVSYETTFRESEPLNDGHRQTIETFLQSEAGVALIHHLWSQSNSVGMALVRPVEDPQTIMLPDGRGGAPAAPWTPLRHNYRAGMVNGLNQAINLIVSAVVEQPKPQQQEESNV